MTQISLDSHMAGRHEPQPITGPSTRTPKHSAPQPKRRHWPTWSLRERPSSKAGKPKQVTTRTLFDHIQKVLSHDEEFASSTLSPSLAGDDGRSCAGKDHANRDCISPHSRLQRRHA